MYEQYYKLQHDPFRLSPSNRPAFRHESFNHAKTYMLYALRKGEGVVLVTGRPGTGKTALLREFVDTVKGESVITADLVSTQLQAEDLMRMIAFSFGIEKLTGSESEIFNELQLLLTGMHNFGRRPLLIIDEAQNLEIRSLRKIERLVGLRWKDQPLVQIFLIGRENLREKLLGSQLESLYGQVDAVICLEPLAAEQTGPYVRHRLSQVGWHDNPRLDDAIFPVIFNYSHGIPRLINHICSQLLLLGMSENKHRLDISDVNRVVLEMASDRTLPSPLVPDQQFTP